ncbi:acetate--CoA ligase alpha subunit [Thermodesulfobacterium thermophilum]|uniref:acetate--CoA ligase alpha subunit n=1 Tax=Thermodesulfobacterium thermophilum TaxID=886 RepID=UPI0003B674FF|nr:acetate--CoA ligase [Thermodesulfobacterium thermophilum]
MLDFIFKPESIAVVGASEEEKKIGHIILKNLLTQGYAGKLFPINPKRKEILGLKCYPSVSAVGEKIDLAVIVVPAKVVPSVIKDCGEAGVKGVVVITAGFKETGEEGAKLEREILDLIKKYGIRMVGPNCLGVINTELGINATFAPELPPKGRVSFFSQSGALGVALIDWAIGSGFGFGKFVSFGNKADLNETDFLEYFGEDEDTDIILGYIEDVKDGKRFIEVAKRVAKKKPVILIKSGATEAGARAASSHTGALAGSDRAFTEAFRKAGVIRVEGIKELFEVAEVFKSGKFPSGEKLLIVTNAGGPGIIAADTAEKNGLKLYPMSKESIEYLAEKLPPTAALYNPVDVIGDATSERYMVVLERAVVDPNVDGVCVILTPQAMTDVENVAKIMLEKSKETEKPFVGCFIGGPKVREATSYLKTNNIACYEDPLIAINAYSKLVHYVKYKHREEDEYIKFPISEEVKKEIGLMLEALRDAGVSVIGEENAMKILSLYGIEFPRRGLARTADEAVKIAEQIGYPVVMKISSPHIIHKTDVGGVKVGLKDEKEVREAFLEMTINVKRAMPGAYIKGVNIYEMVTGGKEVILGVTYDNTFGHMIMFGLGGVYVEVLKDVSFRLTPVGKREAYEMIEEIKGKKLLEGVRGEKPCDKDAIVDKILRLSQLVEEFPIIKEIDINPYLVKELGGVALDARIIIG